MKSTFLRLFFSLFFLTVFFIPTPVSAQQPGDSAISWQTVEQVKELMKTKPRPILVLFYNPADDSSKIMMNTTLRMKEVCTYVNRRFYAVKIDVASQTPIVFFDNKTYLRQPGMKYNDIVLKVIGEKSVVPSLLFYNKETAGFTFKGYRDRYDMLCMLVYFAEEVEKTTPYDFWSTAYLKAFPKKVTQKVTEFPIHWYTLSQALALNKQNPKRIFIEWFTSWNASSTVMLSNAFEHPKVAEYMNEHFYCVRLDAQTNDTLVWQTPYYNDNKPGHYHQLALQQLQRIMKFPALLFFDSESKLIVQQQNYLGAVNFFTLANFVESDSFKTMKLQDFVKTFNPGW